MVNPKENSAYTSKREGMAPFFPLATKSKPPGHAAHLWQNTTEMP